MNSPNLLGGPGGKGVTVGVGVYVGVGGSGVLVGNGVAVNLGGVGVMTGAAARRPRISAQGRNAL